MRDMSRSVLPGYGIAGASTALATLAQFPARSLLGSQHLYSFFYVAVMVTAWYAGLRRALLALVLGTLSAIYFFLPPENSLAVTGAANQIGLAVYLCVALTSMLLIEALRHQRGHAEELAQSQALFLGREQAAAADARELERRLAEERQAALAMAEELKASKEELAKANDEIQRQRDALQELMEALQHSRSDG